jgi:Ni,Fe-hydrogenase III large subunit/Ni,Fe-hydrogenase III component G
VGLSRWLQRVTSSGTEPPAETIVIDSADWHDLALDIASAGGRLLALWATHRSSAAHTLHAVAIIPSRTICVAINLPPGSTTCIGIEDVFPGAARMQRAIFDLTGLRCSNAADVRPWLRHAAWPEDAFPLGDTPMPEPVENAVDDYAFVRVEGDGVHEIAVGPVHAGIIEPGHFRFSVVGEKVLRLEERLGYVHKGIEHRFTELPILDGHRLAARVSGDSCVAYSWAYCLALERMAGTAIPPRAAWLRALALELERLGNHLGDLGALGNDAGFAFGLAQFLRLKERLLRTIAASLGQRYLNDFVVPGGTCRDLSASGADALMRCVGELAGEVSILRGIYEEHTGLRDRFAGAGTLAPELAAWLGVAGLAGRASGQSLDLRLDAPVAPYPELGVRRCTQSEGDVLARVNLRFDEVIESLRLIRTILHDMPRDGHAVRLLPPADGETAVGLIEGWRGPVVVGLEAGPKGTIRRCHPQDPSWLNWPALEHAVIGNIVPDFPLINKSFNLSYSGHDL